MTDQIENVLQIENLDRLASFVNELAHWKRSEDEALAKTEAELRRQNELKAFEEMEKEQRAKEQQKRETEAHIAEAQRRLQKKMGKNVDEVEEDLESAEQ